MTALSKEHEIILHFFCHSKRSFKLWLTLPVLITHWVLIFFGGFKKNVDANSSALFSSIYSRSINKYFRRIKLAFAREPSFSTILSITFFKLSCQHVVFYNFFPSLHKFSFFWAINNKFFAFTRALSSSVLFMCPSYCNLRSCKNSFIFPLSVILRMASLLKPTLKCFTSNGTSIHISVLSFVHFFCNFLWSSFFQLWELPELIIRGAQWIDYKWNRKYFEGLITALPFCPKT